MAGRFDVVTTGLQDVYLTGDPQMSYFLTRFKRHTQFAFDVNECQFDGIVDYGGTLNCKIPQFRADFIKNMTIKLTRDPLSPFGKSWCPSFMSHLIEFAELYIGGRLIEKITGEYIYLYQQLRNNDFDTRQTLYFLTGHGDLLDYYAGEYTYFLDLPFYFYRNPELSIPICALSKQNVEVKIKLRKFNEVILDPSSYGGKIKRISLNVENIYVTPEEKSFFMSNEINHLITQLQLSRFKMKNNESKRDVLLNLQNPIREMFFVSQSNVSVNSNFSNQYNTIKNVKLNINNEILFNKNGKEVGYDHVLEKYVNSPIASDFGGPIEIDQRKFGPNVFGNHSFALNPMRLEPSGHINMSRIGYKLLSIEIEPLSNINTNTLTTQVATENSTMPFTRTTDTQTPFTETVTTGITTITTTPITTTNTTTTKMERVDATVTTINSVLMTIGLLRGPSNLQPGNTSGPTTYSSYTRATGASPTTVYGSDVYGTPVDTVGSTTSSTVTVFQDPVSVPSTTLGQKTIDSTTSESTSTTLIRTGTVPTINLPTQIDFVDVVTSTPITTTPVRVIGDIDSLLKGSVDSTPVVNSTGSSSLNPVAGTDETSYSGGSSLSEAGSSVIFQLSNSTLNQSGAPGSVTTVVYSTVSNPGGVGSQHGGALNPIPSYTPQYTNIRFNNETKLSNHGSCCQMSRNGERIVSTHNVNYFAPAAHIYRHIKGIPQAFRPHANYSFQQTPPGPFTIGETYLNEYFVSAKNSLASTSEYFFESAKQTVTNYDGSVIAGSNYYQMSWSGLNGRPGAEAIDIWNYTETWNLGVEGNGSWAKTFQLDKPTDMEPCHFGHSMSMNDIGDRLAVSGVAYFTDTETYTSSADKAPVQPQYGTGSCNKVVIYDYVPATPANQVGPVAGPGAYLSMGSGGSWVSHQIQLPADNNNHGIQVALSGDGYTLCVSMHGNDTGTIDCTGRVFVYTWVSGTTWSLNQVQDYGRGMPGEKTLPSSMTWGNTATAMLGGSISVNKDGTILVVGAPGYDGGRVFVYHMKYPHYGSSFVKEIFPHLGFYIPGKSTPYHFGFGNKVAISSDGTRVIISSRQGPVELWDINPGYAGGGVSFNSYSFSNGPSQGVDDITQVSINEDGTKYIYSGGYTYYGTTGSAKIFEGGSAAILNPIGLSTQQTGDFLVEDGCDYRTFRYPDSSFFSTVNLGMPPYEVEQKITTTPNITTSYVITPFDSVQQVQLLSQRVDENEEITDVITTGTDDTTTTVTGIRSQTEIATIQSLVTVPIPDHGYYILTTQVDTESFLSVPFTLTTDTQTPFTETITTDTTTTTITPVTITKNVTTKKERVDTIATTVTTITEKIGLSFNPSVPQTVADVVSSTAVINTLDDPISTVIVSTVDGTPAVTTSAAVSPTVTVFQDPVSVPSTTLGQKTIDSTTSATSYEMFKRTGTLPTNTSLTQIEFTVTQSSTPNTTTPVRVEGNIEDLLQSAVDSTPVVISTGTNAIGTTNTDDTQNVSQGPSLSQPGSGVITFQISNPTDSLGDSTSSTVGVNTGGFLSGTIYIDIEPTVFDIYDVSDYSFDLETTLPKYGNICHISKDGSRIISTNGGLSDVPMHIYRYMTEVEVSQGTPIYSRGGQVTGYNNDGVILTNLFGMEYIETYTNSKTDNNTRFLDHTFNQNVTNSDGSVSVSSYYRLEGTYANYINMSGYTTGTHVGYKRGPGASPNYVSILPGYSGGIERREDWNFAVGPGSSAAPDSNASFPPTYASASDFYIGWYWSVFIDGIDARTVSTIGLKWFRPLDNKLWEYTGQGNWSEISFPKYNTTTHIHTDSFNLTSAGPNETHINVMRYTESWDAATVGNGTWSTIEQLYQPANTPSMNYGHSMSMGNTGNRLAVSGVVIPSVQSTSANFVVIYDYSNGSWSSNQIQLSTQSGNYGIQVALTGDGNTLCVSMHGNDSGTIDCDGRLFLYTYSNSTWSLSSELDLPTPAPSSPSTSMFGRSIAISDDADTIIVGAPNWSGGRAFLYRIAADTIHPITQNTSSVTNFGHRVDISADGKRVLIGSRTGGVELWSTETTTPSFVSYHNDNGTNRVTDVSVNEDGSKFVYSSPESERLYVNDARVTDTEISVTSGIIYNENYTYAPPVNNVQQTTTNRQQRIFKVPIQETETPTTTTVATTTPFDSVQEIEDLTSRTEVNVTTRNAITTGTNDTTTTSTGIRDQIETTTTTSILSDVIEQEHDTRVYAVNYNVLTFRDGLAGLRF